MTFNFNDQPEYELNTCLIEELISLYGVLTKFLITEKINLDSSVFGDHSHLKSDNSKIYDIYMLPENSEEWDTEGGMFDQIDLVNLDNVSLFVAKSSFDNIIDMKKIIGNILIFPNNKVMEITALDPTTPGVNNLFTYANAKSAYKLTCKPYHFKIINELDNNDISVDPDVPYETLDGYFDDLTYQTEEQDTEALITKQVTAIDNDGTEVLKPIVDTTEDDVWGQFN